MDTHRRIEDLSIDGGVLCLNFINTVHDYTAPEPYDYFQDHDDWLKWLDLLEVLPGGEVMNSGSKGPERQMEVIDKIRTVRSVLYRVFRSVARNEPCDSGLLKSFNLHLSEALSAIRIEQEEEELVLGWKETDDKAELPTAVILKSAYDLIVDGPFNRIKECRLCGWLFLDQSKNNSRRWCNMQACGSVHKARRYYYRKKEENKRS